MNSIQIKLHKFYFSKFYILVFLTCLASFITICSLPCKADIYYLIRFLPLVFLFSILLSGKMLLNLNKSLVTLIIFAGYLIKMVIYPLLFSIGGYVSFFDRPTNTFNNVSKACLLMSLENILVFIGINLYSTNYAKNTKRNLIVRKFDMRFILLLVFLLFAFLLLSYVFLPSINKSYVLVFNASLTKISKISWDVETVAARGTIERYIYSLFTFIWPIVRIALPPLLISQIRHKLGDKKISLILSTACLIIPTLFLGEDNVGPFLGILVGICSLIKLYGKKSYFVIVPLAVLTIIAAVVIVSTKLASFEDWRGASGIASIAQIINAYFPGVDNYGMCFYINDENKLVTLFYDLYYAIPFKETLFGLSGSHLNDLYTVATNTPGQIVPWGYQLAHYFTIMGSPIITFFFSLFALKSEIIAKRTDNFWKFYTRLLIAIMIAISFSCYWVSTFIRFLLYVYIPLSLLSLFSHRKKSEQVNLLSTVNC